MMISIGVFTKMPSRPTLAEPASAAIVCHHLNRAFNRGANLRG
jgi:hypothetical protein